MPKGRVEIVKPKFALDGKYNTFADYCNCPLFRFTQNCSHVKAFQAAMVAKADQKSKKISKPKKKPEVQINPQPQDEQKKPARAAPKKKIISKAQV